MRLSPTSSMGSRKHLRTVLAVLFRLFLSAAVKKSEYSHQTRLFSGYFFSAQEKSDSSDAGKESSSDAGPDGQDASSPSSSKTKESTPGYEEKVVRTLFV